MEIYLTGSFFALRSDNSSNKSGKEGKVFRASFGKLATLRSFFREGRMSNLLYILHATVYKVPPQNVLAAFLSSFGSLIIYR